MSHSLAWRRFPPSGSKIDATSECGTQRQIGDPNDIVREALRAFAFACEASGDRNNTLSDDRTKVMDTHIQEIEVDFFKLLTTPSSLVPSTCQARREIQPTFLARQDCTMMSHYSEACVHFGNRPPPPKLIIAWRSYCCGFNKHISALRVTQLHRTIVKAIASAE
jgi:hypothetical protein